MSEWKALVGRITLFPAPSSVALPSALELYKKVWVGEPNSFQGATNPLSQSLAQGKSGSLAVSCAANSTRIDLTLSPVGPETPPERPTFFAIEDTKEFSDEFARIARLVETNLLANPIVRVATYFQFVSIEVDSKEANKTLMSIIPKQYRLMLNDEEEFILQINRPHKSSSVENLKMNFITKWSVDRFQIFSYFVPVGTAPITVPQSGVPPNVVEFLAASVAFDNNNTPVPANPPLSSTQQSSLLLEGFRNSVASIREGNLNIKGFENEKLVH